MDHILIHIPKTGGSTLLNEFGKNLEQPNFFYRHVTHINQKSNSGDIFDISNLNIYNKYKLILIIRNPLERLESEFSFLLNRVSFQIHYKNMDNAIFPNTFKLYSECTSNHNSICKFLLGRKMFDKQPVHESDFNNIIYCLNNLHVIYGLTEDYSNTLNNIGFELNKKFNKEINNKRLNFNKLSRDDEWNNIVNDFNENNKWDNLLYKFVNEKFYKQIENLPRKYKNISYTFENNIYRDLYNYLVGINKNAGLIKIFIHDELWLERNAKKLKVVNDILFFLLEKRQINDGKTYCKEWIKLVSKTFKLSEDISINNNSDPYENVKNICEKLVTL